MTFAEQMQLIAGLDALVSDEEDILHRAANEVGFTNVHFNASIARMASWSKYTRPTIYSACGLRKTSPASFLIAACLWTETHSGDKWATAALTTFQARIRGNDDSAGLPPFSCGLKETVDHWCQRIETWFLSHTEPTGDWWPQHGKLANLDLLRMTDEFVHLVILEHARLIEAQVGTKHEAALRTRYAAPVVRPSIYELRDSPIPALAVDASACDDPYINPWWTPRHDTLIYEAIKEDLWHWVQTIGQRVISITPLEALQLWQRQAPQHHAITISISLFAQGRAQKIGALRSLPLPRRKTCPLCQKDFMEDSLPRAVAVRLGYNRLNVCSPCLSETLWHSDDTMSHEDTIRYIQDLVDVLECIPSMTFGQIEGDLLGLSDDNLLTVLRVLGRNPGKQRIKELFGSWLNALIAAGVLEGGVRRTSRGTHCIAKDGHLCLSLAEKTIDDWLHTRGVAHEKEPPYPEGNYRADFRVNGALIEYLGLVGKEEYDRKTELKQQICRRHAVRLVLLYPHDVVNPARLQQKLAGALGRT